MVADYLLNRGLSYSKSGNLYNALDDFSRCLETSPNHLKVLCLSITIIIIIQALYNRALLFFSVNMLKSCIADYDALLRHDNRNIVALAARSLAFLKCRPPQYNMALSDSSTIITLRPNDASAYLVRGKSHLGLGQPLEASHDFARCLAIANGDGDNDKQFQVIKKDKSESFSDVVKAKYLYGKSLLILGQFDKAREVLLQAMSDCDDVDVAVQKTNDKMAKLDAALARRGHDDDIKSANKALKSLTSDLLVNPSRLTWDELVDAVSCVGHCCRQLSMWDEALRHYDFCCFVLGLLKNVESKVVSIKGDEYYLFGVDASPDPEQSEQTLTSLHISMMDERLMLYNKVVVVIVWYVTCRYYTTKDMCWSDVDVKMKLYHHLQCC